MTEKNIEMPLPDCENELKEAIAGNKIAAYKIGEWVDLCMKACERSEPKVSFQDWYVKKFGKELSYSTAMKYRAIFQTCVGHPEWVLTFSLSTLHNLCAKSCPKDLRKHLFENGNPKVPNKAYAEVIQGIIDGIYDLRGPEVQALCRFDEERDDYRERKKVDSSQITELKNSRNIVKSRSVAVNNSSLSENGKSIVKETDKKIIELIDLELDTYKNHSKKHEFRLPKKTLRRRNDSQI